MTVIKRLFDRQGGSIFRSFMRSAFGLAILLGAPISAPIMAAIIVCTEWVFQLGCYLTTGTTDPTLPGADLQAEADVIKVAVAEAVAATSGLSATGQTTGQPDS